MEYICSHKFFGIDMPSQIQSDRSKWWMCDISNISNQKDSPIKDLGCVSGIDTI